MGNKTWVCSLCSQDFTRKYSAYRHSRDLHHGQGKILRVIDYMIGRIAGEYSPGNPLMYRSRYKQHNSTSNSNTKSFPFASIAHDSSQRGFSNTPSQNEGYVPNRQANINLVQPSSDSNNGFTSKLDEIRKLYRRLFPSQTEDAFLKKLSLQVIENGGNEAILDSCLQGLRKNMNMMEALRHLSGASANQANSPHPPPLHNHNVRHLPESSRIKLAQIEQILTTTKHEAFVWEDIKRLIQKCETTTDHTFLDCELESLWRNGFK